MLVLKISRCSTVAGTLRTFPCVTEDLHTIPADNANVHVCKALKLCECMAWHEINILVDVYCDWKVTSNMDHLCAMELQNLISTGAAKGNQNFFQLFSLKHTIFMKRDCNAVRNTG